MDCFAVPGKVWVGRMCQHDTPSLRGALATKQSILSLCGGMDCFAVLAKTWMGSICQHDTPSLRGALATKQSILSLRRHGLLPPSLFVLRPTLRSPPNARFFPPSSQPLAHNT